MYIIRKNKYNFSEEQLFVVGKRDNNKKRNFLFISKLLGKHLAVKPDVIKATGFLLSSLKYNFNNNSFVDCIKNNCKPEYSNHAIDSDVLVIGFCETATALGLSVAASIDGATYIATTREPICNIKQLVTFEEEHSHASTHYMFSNDINLNNYKKIILVDDEITTGNSILHLMNTLIQNSDVAEISIMTILDWRNDEQKQKFKEFSLANNVVINIYSLISGHLTDDNNNVYVNEHIDIIERTKESTNLSIFQQVKICNQELLPQFFFLDSGRFGITYNQILSIEDKAKEAAHNISQKLNPNSDILVLGHGENIYIPSRVATYLESLGHIVSFKTTSRTPIYCDGTVIKDIHAFYENGIKYHFYNKSEAETHDAVIMLSENYFKHKLCDNILIFDL